MLSQWLSAIASLDRATPCALARTRVTWAAAWIATNKVKSSSSSSWPITFPSFLARSEKCSRTSTTTSMITQQWTLWTWWISWRSGETRTRNYTFKCKTTLPRSARRRVRPTAASERKKKSKKIKGLNSLPPPRPRRNRRTSPPRGIPTPTRT